MSRPSGTVAGFGKNGTAPHNPGTSVFQSDYQKFVRLALPLRSSAASCLPPPSSLGRTIRPRRSGTCRCRRAQCTTTRRTCAREAKVEGEGARLESSCDDSAGSAQHAPAIRPCACRKPSRWGVRCSGSRQRDSIASAPRYRGYYWGRYPIRSWVLLYI